MKKAKEIFFDLCMMAGVVASFAAFIFFVGTL